MKRLMLLCAIVATLSACASSSKLSSAERLSMYRAAAGAPVRDFSYFGRLNGWQPLGDEAVAVWTKPKEAFLLELGGPCPDLEYAPSLLISNFGSRVSTMDSVRPVGGGAGMRIPCRIREIRPLDLSSLKEAEKMREAQLEQRKEGDAAN